MSVGLLARRKETAELGMKSGAVFKAEEGKESKTEGLGDEHGTEYRFGYLFQLVEGTVEVQVADYFGHGWPWADSEMNPSG
jgi:hypothetical protein